MEPFRIDLNVMLPSSLNIDKTMEQIEEDLGYQREDPSADTYVNYGVNWGYTSAQAESEMDPGLAIAMAAFLILVIFTGYLIIYNIFQISVTGDIRYYGLLKTIGVTPRQLKRIIRQQALLLCAIGCPVGLAAGWLVGYLLVPLVIERTSLGEISASVSGSPLIFLVSAFFTVVTVLLSCKKPGRMAAKVSPVEAVKYTEAAFSSKRKRKREHAGVGRMALANLGRNKKKNRAGCGIAVPFRGAFGRYLFVHRRIQHGKVSGKQDLRGFYRGKYRLFPLSCQRTGVRDICGRNRDDTKPYQNRRGRTGLGGSGKLSAGLAEQTAVSKHGLRRFG